MKGHGSNISNSNSAKKITTPKNTQHRIINKVSSPINTRSKTKHNNTYLNGKPADGFKVLHQKSNHDSTLIPVIKTNTSAQTDMSYCGLIDTDSDLLKKLDFLTQQNEELVKNTTKLQHYNEVKCQKYNADLEKIGEEGDKLKAELNRKVSKYKDEIRSLTEIIRIMENDAQVKTSSLESKILVLKEENIKLKSRINFIEATPGSSGYVPPLPFKYPIKTNNKFEVLNKIDNNNKFLPTNAKKCKTNRQVTSKQRNIPNHSRQTCTLTRNDITVVGDSHCRGVAEYLSEILQGKYVAQGTTMPNGRLLNVAEALKQKGFRSSLGDCLVIMAGANDVYIGQTQNIYKYYKNMMLSNKVPLTIVVSIPLRRDLLLSHPINEAIIDANIYLNDIAQASNNIFLDIATFPSIYTSRDGIHLNNDGKKLLSKLICKKFIGMTQNTNSSTIATQLNTELPGTLERPSSAYSTSEKHSSKPKIVYRHKSTISMPNQCTSLPGNLEKCSLDKGHCIIQHESIAAERQLKDTISISSIEEYPPLPTPPSIRAILQDEYTITSTPKQLSVTTSPSLEKLEPYVESGTSSLPTVSLSVDQPSIDSVNSPFLGWSTPIQSQNKVLKFRSVYSSYVLSGSPACSSLVGEKVLSEKQSFSANLGVSGKPISLSSETKNDSYI